MFQVPFSPGCVLFRAVMRSTTSAHRRPFTPPIESRHFKHGPPKPPGTSPRVCAYGANVAAICLSGGKTCRALFSFSRPAPLRLARAGRRWGRAVGPPRPGFAGFTPRAPGTPRRNAVSCRLLCATFTRGDADIFRPEARRMVGASERKMFSAFTDLKAFPRALMFRHVQRCDDSPSVQRPASRASPAAYLNALFAILQKGA